MNHLVGCGIGLALALVIVSLAGGSVGALGVLIAALICPLVLLAALHILSRGGHHAGRRASEQEDTPAAPERSVP
jgi:hypothetical protein